MAKSERTISLHTTKKILRTAPKPKDRIEEEKTELGVARSKKRKKVTQKKQNSHHDGAGGKIKVWGPLEKNETKE